MTHGSVTVEFEKYSSSDELGREDAALLQTARQSVSNAYAPYSGFNVGAAAKLSDGAVVTGSNQENASFPVGMCAERGLLGAVASMHPSASILTLAISYRASEGNSDHPVAPCGLGRQSLFDSQTRSGLPIRLILAGIQGPVYIVPNAGSLLPLAFSAEELR